MEIDDKKVEIIDNFTFVKMRNLENYRINHFSCFYLY